MSDSNQKHNDMSPAPAPSPSPPKGAPIWMVLLVLLLVAASFVAGALVWPRLQDDGVLRAMGVSAPSHDHAGDGQTASESAAYFTCGMHPWVLLPAPGLCPICHMDLTPVDPAAFTGEVAIDPVVVQNIGVRAKPVEVGPIQKTIRTLGTIEYDETTLRDVNIKVEGWIEELFVDFVGADVRAGDPLFDLYSPRLYAAQEEYLSALRLARNGATTGGLDPQRLLADARTQLEFLDMTDAQIRQLEERGEAMRRTPILSPHTGVVIDKHANEGMRVEPGMRVFRVADLSKVWVIASVYEHQLPFIEVGQTATMSLSYIPGQTFEGQVVYVYPFLDSSSRQAMVRLAFDNPYGLLKPGMFANVELRNMLARERTLAPRSAIIDTGERQVAFVSLGDGRFEPRGLRTGLTTDGDRIEILDGLKPGEMVVTSAQFLLDSESRLRDALAKMMSGDLVATSAATAAVAAPSALTSLPAPVESLLIEMLEDYLAIGDLLARDTMDGAAAVANQIVQTAGELVEQEIPGDPHFWHTHDDPATIGAAARKLTDATDIATARRHYADLSLAMSALIRATGVPPSFDLEVQELRCPMYREDQGGGYWLQPGGDVRNPFFGSMMLRCFDQRITLPVTGAGAEATPEDDSAADAAPAATPTTPLQIPQGLADEIYRAYLHSQDALTRDELAQATDALATLSVALDRVPIDNASSQPPLLARLQSAVSIDTTSLESFRLGYRELSDAMIELARVAPPSTAIGPAIRHAYCPMEEANWLQLGEDVANPYDPGMLRCGWIEESFETAAPPAGANP